MEPLTIADVFRSNLFTSVALVAAINEIAYVPQRLMEVGIFDVQGIPTTVAFIEKKGETLALVPNTPRGGPGTSVAIDKREAIPFQSTHLELTDKIYADEIQNVRSFGNGNQLQGVEEVRDQRLTKMSRSLDLTLEYHRLGAIQGLVLDADGTTVIEDLYDKFGISEPAAIDMNLDAAWTSEDGGVVRKKLAGVTRGVDDSLGGLKPSGYWAPCGDDFFDALTGHPEIRDTYLRQSEARELRGDGRRAFSYGGVEWENYRGQGAVALADNVARIVPIGVPELFKTLFAPADTMAAVNTLGLPKYASAAPDPSGHDKFIEVASQSNPINFCTRPGALRKLTLT